MDKIYPDTREGAFRFLTDCFLEPIKRPIQIIVDPQVDGVWKAENEDFIAIVYLKGYKTPFGNIREYNDLEITELKIK